MTGLFADKPRRIFSRKKRRSRFLPSLLFILLILSILIFVCRVDAHAGYLDDVGFTALFSTPGLDLPSGSAVSVSQIEARDGSGLYMPDKALADFDGKTIGNKTGITDGISGHATSVGLKFYGNTGSMAAGITNIDIYDAGNWLWYDYLALGLFSGTTPVQPLYSVTPGILSSPSRVANHSWVGGNTGINTDVLRRLDFVVEADEYIQVVAVNNGSTQYPLLSSTYNAITVGRTDGDHAKGTAAVDSLYGAGRACPLIVVPVSPTSYAAPVVAAACSLLVETGLNSTLSTDPLVRVTVDRSGRSIYNAATSEVVKAALLAGAERVTHNTDPPDIVDYRFSFPNRTANGLDNRFGAGQLNMENSYHIVAGGEQNSLEDDMDRGGQIGFHGFDRDPAFGGQAGSNRRARYFFTADESHQWLYMALVWHLDVDGGTSNDWNGNAWLFDLDLALYDVTHEASPRLIAFSNSRIDNTENLWAPLVPGRRYRIEVTAAEGQEDFSWDYALAWRMKTPPDSDMDGIPDDWEVRFGLDYQTPDDALYDPDGDGLNNRDECRAGTDIMLPDTDMDGASDGSELGAGSDPLNPDAISAPVPVPAAHGIWLLPLTGLMLWLGVTRNTKPVSIP